MGSNLTLRVVISNDGTLCGRRHLSRDQREAICTDSYVKRRSAPMRILLALPIVVVAGCLASRLQSMQSQGTDSQSSASRFDPAQRLSATAFEQNATMKDTSAHEDPNLLKVGVPRDRIIAAFGTPNQIINQGGQEEEVYEFNPDGSKFVKPKVYARNIAAGGFTGGIATRGPQARIHEAAQHPTVHHLTFGSEGTIKSVPNESPNGHRPHAAPQD